MPGPDLDEQLQIRMNRALSVHREGRLGDAESLYRQVLALRPEHPEALKLLGLVRLTQGSPEEGLSWMERALAQDPEDWSAWFNHARALSALGREEEALSSLGRACRLRPDRAEPWVQLARALAQLGRYEEALPVAARAASLSQTGAWLHGSLLVAAGRHREGAEVLAALGDAPGLPPTRHALLAGAWQRAGHYDRAEPAWRAALEIQPDAPELQAGLGLCLLDLGRSDEATALLRRALREGPQAARLAAGLTDTLFGMAGDATRLAPLLLLLLAREDIDHQRLDRVTREAMTARAGALLAERPEPEALERDAEQLARDPTFQLALPRLILRHPTWERALGRMRALALRRAIEGRPLERVGVVGLAAHAWNTEQVDPPTDQDLARARALAALPPDPPEAWPARTWDALAAAATAISLPEIPGHQRLLSPGWELRPLAPLVRAQLHEPALERALQDRIPTLALSEDSTSAAVRAQYEEHPYPRLIGVQRREPRPLGEVVRGLLERPDLTPPVAGPTRILVAGCGTGQHALTTALSVADAEVLAVDLSRASLARALRTAARLGASNVRFAQADILALDSLEPVFHVVEAVGVLHHLADPGLGLRVLRDRLAPGGWMRVGLYSERGRSEVVAARALIAERGYNADPDGIRAARRALLALPPEHPAWPVRWSPDLYSVSGTRDLLFHPCEHRTSPAGLAGLLAGLDLEFLGFQHALPEGPRSYRALRPDARAQTDLAVWEKLEDEHPRLFSGMLVFWCRRRG